MHSLNKIDASDYLFCPGYNHYHHCQRLMDSQDFPHKSSSQHPFNDIEHINLRVDGVIDLLNNLQCTIEKQISFNLELLELKKEKDKKEYELREHSLKMEMVFKERNQKLKEEAQNRKEKDEKRKEQERILNQDLNKLQPVLREAFERMQAEILKEWENDGLFGDVSASDDVEH